MTVHAQVARRAAAPSSYRPLLQSDCARKGASRSAGECCREKPSSAAPRSPERNNPPASQPRLNIAAAYGPHEQEARRGAEVLHDGVGPSLASQAGPSSSAPAQTASERMPHAGVQVAQVLSTPGAPLDAGTGRFYAAHLGHNFSNVRVHADPAAADSARALGARAYTVGCHIVFGARAAQEQSWRRPSRLLSHELIHVQQMRHLPPAGATKSTLPVMRDQEGGGLLPAKDDGLSEKDLSLRRAFAKVLTSVNPARATEKQADDILMLLAAYRAAFPAGSFWFVIEQSDKIDGWLRPFGFINAPVRMNQMGRYSLDVSKEQASFDQALERWRKADARTRSALRQGARYSLRVPSAEQLAAREQEIHTEELEDRRVYTGPNYALRKERAYAVGNVAREKIQGVVSSGPVSLAGRVVGTIAGGQEGGERGAAMGSFGDLALPFLAARRPATGASPSRPPPARLRPPPENIAPAPARTPPAETQPRPPSKPSALSIPSRPATLPRAVAEKAPANENVPQASQKLLPPAPTAPPRTRVTAQPKTPKPPRTARTPKPPKVKPLKTPNPDATEQPKKPKLSTKAERDAKYATGLDRRIARVRNELSEAKQRTVEYKDLRAAAGEKQKGGPSKAIWNKEEELYVLERARAYPGRTILEQVELVGVKGKDGKIRSATEIAGEGRTVDFLEINGAKALGGEVKSRAELVHSVQSLKEPGMEGRFKPTTSKVGQQRTKEELIIDAANAQGGNLLFKGKDVRTGADITLEVDTKDYRSTVVTYDQVMPN